MYFTWSMDYLKLLDRVEMREHGDDSGGGGSTSG